MCKKIIFLVILMINLAGCSNKEELTISVASSLYDPIREIVEIYEKENNIEININQGSSGTLKKQIESGANVDIFFSADKNYMMDLINDDIVKEDNITYPVTNSLVLISNKNSNIKNIEDLSKSYTDTILAIGEINTVPVGKYAKQSLEKLNIYQNLKSNIIYAKDATSVITYVENQQTECGIIYKSDANKLRNSNVIYEFDKNTHENIDYSLAKISENSNNDEIINLINSEIGKEIFGKYNFEVGNK